MLLTRGVSRRVVTALQWEKRCLIRSSRRHISLLHKGLAAHRKDMLQVTLQHTCTKGAVFLSCSAIACMNRLVCLACSVWSTTLCSHLCRRLCTRSAMQQLEYPSQRGTPCTRTFSGRMCILQFISGWQCCGGGHNFTADLVISQCRYQGSKASHQRQDHRVHEQLPSVHQKCDRR